MGSMTIEYRKSRSGMFFRCSSCNAEIEGGADIYHPVTTANGIVVFGKPICSKCYRKVKDE